MPHIGKPQRIPRLFLLGQGERETEFFNDRIGEHFASDALDFGLRLFARKSSVQRQLKIFSLAHTLQALVAHLLERALTGFALGVEDAFLQRYINVGCHKTIIINDGSWTSDFGLQTSDLSFEVSVLGPRSEV